MSQMSRAGRAGVPIRRPDSRYMRRQHARVTRKLHVGARDFLPHACRRVPDWSSWPPHAMKNRMPRTALAPQTGASTAAVDSRLDPTLVAEACRAEVHSASCSLRFYPQSSSDLGAQCSAVIVRPRMHEAAAARASRGLQTQPSCSSTALPRCCGIKCLAARASGAATGHQDGRSARQRYHLKRAGALRPAVPMPRARGGRVSAQSRESA